MANKKYNNNNADHETITTTTSSSASAAVIAAPAGSPTTTTGSPHFPSLWHTIDDDDIAGTTATIFVTTKPKPLLVKEGSLKPCIQVSHQL